VTERGCVEDQPQRVGSSKASGACRVLRLVEDDTAALRFQQRGPMNIIQITPGAGGMYCGGCLRDNALVAALRQAGHHPLMVPLYLPLTLDEPDQSAGAPIFFSGINVYLDQKSALFRRA